MPEKRGQIISERGNQVIGNLPYFIGQWVSLRSLISHHHIRTVPNFAGPRTQRTAPSSTDKSKSA